MPVTCASCNVPLMPDDKIIYWRDVGKIKDFIHMACEDNWVTFLDLEGFLVDNREIRHSNVHYMWRNDQQKGWHAALHTYESELKQKGLLTNDQEETEALWTEDTCSQ